MSSRTRVSPHTLREENEKRQIETKWAAFLVYKRQQATGWRDAGAKEEGSVPRLGCYLPFRKHSFSLKSKQTNYIDRYNTVRSHPTKYETQFVRLIYNNHYILSNWYSSCTGHCSWIFPGHTRHCHGNNNNNNYYYYSSSSSSSSIVVGLRVVCIHLSHYEIDFIITLSHNYW